MDSVWKGVVMGIIVILIFPWFSKFLNLYYDWVGTFN